MESLAESDVEKMCIDCNMLSHTAAPCAVEPHRRRVTGVDHGFVARLPFLMPAAEKDECAGADDDDFAIMPKLRRTCLKANRKPPDAIAARPPPVASAAADDADNDSHGSEADSEDAEICYSTACCRSRRLRPAFLLGSPGPRCRKHVLAMSAFRYTGFRPWPSGIMIFHGFRPWPGCVRRLRLESHHTHT